MPWKRVLAAGGVAGLADVGEFVNEDVIYQSRR